MADHRTLSLDLVIFGGGAAGLWLLDEALRRGFRAVLLEAHELGAGQTIASQGIIHGGLKYTLSGLLTPSARAIADMPLIWRRCLAGEQQPDLSATRLRAEFCHLWRSTSISGMIGMAGARAGLRVAPVKLRDHERPEALHGLKGVVARLDEQVIDPESHIGVLADRHRPRLLRIDDRSGLEFDCARPGHVDLIRLLNPATGEPLDLRPKWTVFAAGAGNETLLSHVDLEHDIAAQRRPLHMVMLRGDLPPLNGHCVDGTTTRVTITTATDSSGRAVWQVGGQVAEDGVRMDPEALIAHAQQELSEVTPGADLTGAQWATYRVDRAEAASRGGRRPDDAVVRSAGNVIAAWPTKLALAPHLAQLVLARLDPPGDTAAADAVHLPDDWPKPAVALPPWETAEQWTADVSETRHST